MDKKTRALFVYDELLKLFEGASCELDFKDNFQLVVAVILSARCTDKRVNMITPNLFSKYPTPVALANADVEDVEKIIFSCGFYKNKAKNIINMARDVVKRFGGVVPNNFDDLVSLSGVGRKTANVVLSVAFHNDTIAVDTHVFRLSNRLGLVKTNNVVVCEEELKKILPKDKWSTFHHLLVLYGRYFCKSIAPQCTECKFKEFCKYYNK